MNLKEVVPYVGLGDLRLGTPRTVVRASLDSPFEPFLKGPLSTRPTDSYDALGFHLYYDAADQLEYIETFRPADPVYSGIHLLRIGRKRVLDQLAALGYEAPYENAGYDFPALGVVFYVPYRKIEAVGLYRRGYYESYK